MERGAVALALVALLTMIACGGSAEEPAPSPTPPSGMFSTLPTTEPPVVGDQPPTIELNTPVPTPTPHPTLTPNPTYTPVPTPTPNPTYTPTPDPTATPVLLPAATPQPTDMPAPMPDRRYNVSITKEGVGSARITWEPAEGATYYKVLYDSFFEGRPGCQLLTNHAIWCEELVSNVTETTYLHEKPGSRRLFGGKIYYWVAACDEHNCRFLNREGAAFGPVEFDLP